MLNLSLLLQSISTLAVGVERNQIWTGLPGRIGQPTFSGAFVGNNNVYQGSIPWLPPNIALEAFKDEVRSCKARKLVRF